MERFKYLIYICNWFLRCKLLKRLLQIGQETRKKSEKQDLADGKYHTRKFAVGHVLNVS